MRKLACKSRTETKFSEAIPPRPDGDSTSYLRQKGGSLRYRMTGAPNHAELARMLREVFPQADFSEAYLDWLYRDAPDGAAITISEQEHESTVAHYAVLLQSYRGPSGSIPLGLVVDIAVAPAHRGKGRMLRIAKIAHDRAGRRGLAALLVVANANSTPILKKRLGFSSLGSLPVLAGWTVPVARSSVRTHRVTPQFLNSDEFRRIAENAAGQHDRGLRADWDERTLRWRLASPRARYLVHATDVGFMVTQRSIHNGLPIAVVLGNFMKNGASPVPTHALLQAACFAHRTPAFVYVGFNPGIAPKGFPVPRFLLPSPLNLLYLPLAKKVPPASAFSLDAFELLNFDAY